MSKEMNFREWLAVSPEKLYGFAPIVGSEKPKKTLYEMEPLENLKVSDVITELEGLGKVGTRIPNRLFESKIAFGDDIGRLTVETSPLGSLKFIVRREITDLQGQKIEVCKSIIPLINDYNHVGEEDKHEEYTIAYNINTLLNEIDKTELEKPSANYDGLRRLTLEMAQEVRARHPKVMIYNGVVENNKNYYTIYFSYTGYGVEASGSVRCEQFNINLNYDTNSGLIRCWGNEVQSKTRVHQWYLVPSEWDEMFSPTQSNKEIITAIREAFSTY